MDFKVGDKVKVLQPGYNFGSLCSYIDHEPFSNLPWKSPGKGACYEVVGVSEKPDCRYGYVYALKSKEGTICYMHNNYTDGRVAPDGLELVEPVRKFRIGDKVVPISKFNMPLEDSCWKYGKAQGYLYIVGNRRNKEDQKAYGCWHDNKGTIWGDCFLESDLTPYVEPLTHKFKIGDKVIPHSKSYGDSFEDWKNDIKPAPYYIVERVWNNGDVGIENGIFKPYDLTLYIKPINHCPENKTIRTDDDTLFIFNGPATICIIEVDGEQFKGVSKCNPAEKWDEKLGKQWAELRAQRAILDAVEEILRQL